MTRAVWLLQVVSPGLKLAGLAGKFGALSAMVLPPSHVDHPNRLVLAITSSMSEEELREELELGDSGKWVVGFCKEEWGPDYPLNDPEFVPLQLDDPLLAWAMKRSPTGANGFDNAAADRFAAEHPGEYFYRHSSQLPPFPPEGQAARKVRPLDEITVSAKEFPWDWRVPKGELPEEDDAQIARAQQANVRVPVSGPNTVYWDILLRFAT